MTRAQTGHQNGSDPFARFAAEGKIDDEPVEVQLLDRTGEPYVNKDGSPLTVTVVGKFSTQYKLAERKLIDRVFKQSRRGVTPDAEDAEARHVERIAGACVGWTLENAEDGKPVPFTPQNVQRFLTIASWVAPQLEQAIEAHERFFVRSSTSS